MKIINTFQRTDNGPNGLICASPSVTQQHFKDDCDINVILRRYVKTGRIDHLNQAVAMYGELPDITDYRSALELIQMADDSFLRLPAELRQSFDNDPAQFLNWMDTPQTDDQRNQYLSQFGLKWHTPPLDVSVPSDTPPPKGADVTLPSSTSDKQG